MKNIEKGSATTCHVATSPDLVEVRGFYFADCKVAEGSEYMQDQGYASNLDMTYSPRSGIDPVI